MCIRDRETTAPMEEKTAEKAEKAEKVPEYQVEVGKEPSTPAPGTPALADEAETPDYTPTPAPRTPLVTPAADVSVDRPHLESTPKRLDFSEPEVAGSPELKELPLHSSQIIPDEAPDPPPVQTKAEAIPVESAPEIGATEAQVLETDDPVTPKGDVVRDFKKGILQS